VTATTVPTAAVILAAGEARRYGSPKQLLSIDGVPMVRRIAGNVLAAGLSPVMVVVGSRAERVVDCLDQMAVHTVENAQWASGMGSSIASGVKALMMQAAPLQSVMVMLADQPAIRVVDLERMLARHAQSPDRILACQHEGRFSPPCIFPWSHAGELAALDGAKGAHVLLERHAALVDGFHLPAAFFDIDTPEDYAAWEAQRGMNPMDASS
jgi:CTP:molybdopterin cytidylyltransferase MocA